MEKKEAVATFYAKQSAYDFLEQRERSFSHGFIVLLIGTLIFYEYQANCLVSLG